MTLLGDGVYHGVQGPYFQPGDVVTVGGVALANATFLNASAVQGVLPNITTLFPHANGSRAVAGYFPIVIAHASADGVPAHVAAVSCPPTCPGSTAASAVGGAYYMYLCDSYLTGPACLDVATAG